jgi:hypothetical protein
MGIDAKLLIKANVTGPDVDVIILLKQETWCLIHVVLLISL